MVFFTLEHVISILPHGHNNGNIGQACDNISYYTSRENTLIPLDESHVSKLLATCVSKGSLKAVTIRRISTRYQGDDVLAPVVNVPFHDSLYC